MKRIALALEYPLMQNGGTEVLVRELLVGLSQDYQIVLVSGDRCQNDLPNALSRLIHQHVSWAPFEASPDTARALGDSLSALGVELAHFHFGANFSWNNRLPARCPIPYTARHGIPIVTTVHMVPGLLHGFCGPQKPLLFKLALLPFAWVNKVRVLRCVKREIAVSRTDCEKLRRWYWPVENRFRQIYHSRIRHVSGAEANVSPNPYERSSPRKKVILNVGHLAERKGQIVLASAFGRIASKFPDWSLLLAGEVAEASCKARIQNIAKECPVSGQIQILGRRDDAAALMREAAVYVQPSFYEGLPLSLQEALYYQCAAAATRIPGNTELIEDQHNGLLVPAGHIEKMADALGLLMGNSELRARLAGQGRDSVLKKRMTSESMVESHRLLFKEVLS